MNKVSERYETMVKSKSEKAKERTAKSAEAPPVEMTILDSVGSNCWPANRVPGAEMPPPELPAVHESEPKKVPQLANLRTKMQRDPQNGQNALAFLKAVISARSFVAVDSFEGRTILGLVPAIVGGGTANAVQVLRQIGALVANSYPFVLRNAVNCVAAFDLLSKKPEGLLVIRQLLQLWSEIFSLPRTEGKKELLAFMVGTNALRRICLVIESVSASDLKAESVKQLTIELINFVAVIAAFLRVEANEEAALIIYHSFLSFLVILGMEPTLLAVDISVKTIRILSHITLLSDDVVASIDQHNAAMLVQTLKVFLAAKNTTLAPVLHELIVLYGLLCGRSAILRESCCWLPPPTVLDRLCQLPLNYFMHKTQSTILLPTIIACCIDSVENSSFVETAVNKRVLVKFIQEMPLTGADIAAPHLRIPVDRRNDLIALFSQP
jgi:hypothetical protein